jgi:hypothetical protein
MTITVDVPDEWVARLRVLGPSAQYQVDLVPTDAMLPAVILELLDHAQQGVYRPGSWERPWLQQAFGDSWEQHLEPDPERTAGDGRIIFQRPRR